MQKIYLYLRHATYGEVEITEPLKTDAFAYTVEQENNAAPIDESADFVGCP